MTDKPKKDPQSKDPKDSRSAESINPNDFLQLLKRGAQFTEELIGEHERLKLRLVRLEEENRLLATRAISKNSYAELLEQMKEMEEERVSLIQKFQAVEEESHSFKNRFREIEEENDRLANLYIASYQLHSTLDLKEVVRITFEIIINLVGSMDFVLFLLDGEKLVPVKTQGRALATVPVVSVGSSVIGNTVVKRTLYTRGDELANGTEDEALVCIPLIAENKVLGVIAVYGFLPHKTSLTELDKELFKLLAGHAAMAMYAARLDAESDQVNHDAASYIKLLSQ